ncbi:MAG: hypothetical protein RR904_05355 [Bacilli bacterium]
MQNVAKKLKHNPFLEMETTEKFYLTNSRYVDDALKMINLLHINNTGYFCLCQKKGEFSTRFLDKQPEFNQMMNYLHLKNLYLSLNSFYIPLRQIKTLRQINSFYLDIDYYKEPKYKNKTTDEMISIMRADGMFIDLEPSFFMDSGNGMYIFYLIEDVPKQAKKLWSEIENKLIEKFKQYGADPVARDLARVLRLAGSINSKTGRRARLILPNAEPIRYTLSQIRDIILPKLPYTKEEWVELKKQRKKHKQEYKNKVNKVNHLFNSYSLNINRAMDIKKIIELRKNEIDGIRNIAFHLFSLFSFYAYGEDEGNKIWNSLIELNSSLIEPLSNTELENIYNSSLAQLEHYTKVLTEYNLNHSNENKINYLRSNGCYLYTNQSIITKLEITPIEMEQLETIIDLKEKNNRKRAKYQKNRESEINRVKEYYQKKLKMDGKISKKEQLNITYGKIKSLLAKGLKQKDISVQLDIKPRTLKRYIKSMKENGLI